MNYLAHLYLSENKPDILLGNFIADSVKGKQFLQYAEGVQKGIKLHRAIDFFTDTHPIVRLSKQRLYANYSKFAGIITDMIYDHFLAICWTRYNEESLVNFTEKVYALIKNRWTELPEKVRFFAPYMMTENWLMRYASLAGIEQSLKGLSSRVTNGDKMQFAVKDIKQNYMQFEEEFSRFFPELIDFSRNTLRDFSQ